ncbi:zinc finger MYM-type protein 1-like [Pseudophryne corroboree]|uniref:zinc finger MYM-type protein 1-like n=1 Tax=Pseudophryne corroboree TaxID=495146 RepID=UPI003081CF30
MMENHQPLISLNGTSNRNTPERCPRPVYSQVHTEENHSVLQEGQGENLTNIKVEDIKEEEETYVWGNKQCKEEEIPTDISTDGASNRNTPERCPRPLYSQDHTEENHTVPQEGQDESSTNIKVEDIKEEAEMHVGGDQQCKEVEIPTAIITDVVADFQPACITLSITFPPPAKIDNDVIARLKSFSKLDTKGKQEVIKNGRPVPELKGLLQKAERKKITRSFHVEWYQRKDWLCGCVLKNRLYCFPCLLFSTIDNVWTNTGFCDLKNLPRSLSKHEKSSVHIQSQIALKTFGTSMLDLALDEQRRLNIGIHNAKVKENREILKYLINATCFLAKQELAFRGTDQSASSSNHGNYVELLHLFAEKDSTLARHLEASTLFSGLSNKIQNDLIEAVGDVLRNDMKEEIKAATFVALEVDETTDVTNKALVSVILRYVAKSEVREAFLGFDDVGEDRRAPVISDYVFGVLEKYNCVNKLVAQTYDGASVLASDIHRMQARIKEKIPEAMVTHCYAHNLNLVLLQSAKCIPECRKFFKTLEGLSAFFNKSTRRAHLLDDVVKQRLPRAGPMRWTSNARLVQVINTYHSDVRAAFQIMSENPDNWDNDTLMMAAGYDHWLSQASTCFFLMAYEGIFKETGSLCRVLQNNIMDIGFCCTRICAIMSAVERQRQEFDSFYNQFEQKCIKLGLTDNAQSNQVMRDERKIIFYNILDNIGVQLKARFDHFADLGFLGLADCTKFYEMSQHFDDAKLQSLSKYTRYFDLVRLKADLIGLYSSQMVRNECKSSRQLLSFLVQNDLMQTVPEATKLLQLVLTMPATAASVERPCSALKRIKIYSRNRTDQGRLSSLAIISIEMERLLRLKENIEDFYNKVTDCFVRRDGRIDFIYQ